MEVCKICVYDTDKRFARQLAAFISRQGEGKYQVIAYTSKELVLEHISNRQIDICVGTDLVMLYELLSRQPQLFGVWLQENNANCISLPEKNVDGKPLTKKIEKGMPLLEILNRQAISEMQEVSEMQAISNIQVVSKYAGARAITEIIWQLTKQIVRRETMSSMVVAMYSPVGRCGKTTFARSLAEGKNGWLYIGLEDYGCVENINVQGEFEWIDSFLYFAKERNEEKIFARMEQSGGVIASAFSPFDTKVLDKEDWEWLVTVLKKQTSYSGTIFDLGTGVLQDASWLSVFDYILVPYLEEPDAQQKRKKMMKLFDVYGQIKVAEKIIFLNMENEQELLERKEKMQYGK